MVANKKTVALAGATAPAGLQERLEKGIRKILSYNAAPLFRMAFRFIAFRFVAQASIKNFNCNIFSVKLIGKAERLVSRDTLWKNKTVSRSTVCRFYEDKKSFT